MEKVTAIAIFFTKSFTFGVVDMHCVGIAVMASTDGGLVV
jgi:hypothetical protein